MQRIPYDRTAAVQYAHTWAYGRNPNYYNYESIGGDCTNFASQCLYAGAHIMDYTPDFGWYYVNPNQKAPAWTGVFYFYQYLTRSRQTAGPFAAQAALSELLPGDIVQLSFDGVRWAHTPVVVAVLQPPSPQNILLAAHSVDCDYRPLSSYSYHAVRGLHLLGVWR